MVGRRPGARTRILRLNPFDLLPCFVPVYRLALFTLWSLGAGLQIRLG